MSFGAYIDKNKVLIIQFDFQNNWSSIFVFGTSYHLQLISGVNKNHYTFAMVWSVAVEDISTPFQSPGVYRLFGTKGFLEKIAVSGLPMKPLKDFPTFNRII